MNILLEKLDNFSKIMEKPRKICIDRLNQIVRKTFQSENIFLKDYGSYSTKLLTPYSDIDLSIQGCQFIDKENSLEILECLSGNLKLFEFVKEIKTILTA